MITSRSSSVSHRILTSLHWPGRAAIAALGSQPCSLQSSAILRGSELRLWPWGLTIEPRWTPKRLLCALIAQRDSANADSSLLAVRSERLRECSNPLGNTEDRVGATAEGKFREP